MEYIKFIKEKIKNYSLITIVRLEFESAILGILSLIPTTLGVLLRAMAVQLLFKKIDGIAFIQPRVTIIHSDRIICGKQLGINSGSYINGIGGIEMGDNVLIGSNVTISSGEHPIEGKFPAIFTRETKHKKITICNDVWIGAGVVIMPGITLATGTVVGANAVITKDTEQYGVYVGIPAKKIRERKD